MKYIAVMGFWLILTFYLIIERIIKTIALIFMLIWELKLQKKDFNIYKKYHLIIGLSIIQFDTLKDYYTGNYSILN